LTLTSGATIAFSDLIKDDTLTTVSTLERLGVSRADLEPHGALEPFVDRCVATFSVEAWRHLGFETDDSDVRLARIQLHEMWQLHGYH